MLPAVTPSRDLLVLLERSLVFLNVRRNVENIRSFMAGYRFHEELLGLGSVLAFRGSLAERRVSVALLDGCLLVF
jgi:hypothetical protein